MHRFDENVNQSFSLAQSEALKRKNTELTPAHFFYGLLLHPKTLVHDTFIGKKKDAVKLLDHLPKSTNGVSLDQLNTSSAMAEWITYASSRAIQSGKEIKESDFLVYVDKYLPQLELDLNELKKQENQEEGNEDKAPGFLVNLNERAETGKLDPVIGRNNEIRTVMEILGRRGKNNPVLVGEAGVGKTAIVEGLADAIVKGQVPDILKGRVVYSLDMGALMAGTKFRGEFEERLQKLLKFMEKQSGMAILFIDEIHQLVGAGKVDGAMDAANLLKPALARGELHCIGATTENEYQKYILGDTALARRFRSVSVKIPSVEDAIEILMGIKEKFEMHHGIKISDEAIFQCVLLSEQYITDKNLPDKAIDLMDEAASAMKLSAQAMPEKLTKIESEIRSKLILAQVEKNKKVKEDLLKTADELKKHFEVEKKKWEKDALAIKQVSEIRNRLDKEKFELEQAERDQDYEKASRIKYSQIPELESQLEKMEHHWILGKKEVAHILAKHKGIPLEKILQSKQDKILELEDYLKSRVYGQDASLKEMAGVLKASYAGLSDISRPMGSFLLLGPSGVGKTETAKSLAKFLFNDEKYMIRLDMSEFSEKHSVAKLIGAPAGYIGHDEGGVLTEAVRRNPYSVILFDEIEKAHPDFSDILLQVLDDGRLTDNKGRTIDFKNTVIFLTSNARDYQNQFKNEVLGRIDSILHYGHLKGENLKRLVNKLLTPLNEKLSAKNLVVKLQDQVIEKLIEQGVHELYGARPLNSLFQKWIICPLSEKILEGKLPEGEIVVDWGPQGVEFQINEKK